MSKPPKRRAGKRKVRSWDRLLWGVRFTTAQDERPLLLGEWWDRADHQRRYTGEPSRILLFTSRRAARIWCQTKTAENRRHSSDWCFTPVRVRDVTELPS